MNIFYLDHDIQKCTEYHCDAHVRKMILEYAMLLSTAHRVLDGQKIKREGKRGYNYQHPNPIFNQTLYYATHINHPDTVWARENNENYMYLYNLFIKLSNEFEYRFGKTHKTYNQLKDILANLPQNIPYLPFTTPPQCMPIQFKDVCTITAYRNFYNLDKQYKFKLIWSKRPEPHWFNKQT